MMSRLTRTPLAVLAAVFALPLAAAAQQPGPRIDPALRQLLSPAVRQALAPSGRFDVLPADAPLPMAGLLAVDRDVRGRPQIGLFVEVSDRAALDALRLRGAQLGTVVHTPEGTLLATATAPLDLADSLTTVRGLVSISAARRIKAENDSGVHAIHADEVRQRVGSTWTGLAGQGVIVGIYDTGLDFRHPDFLDGNGNTRVLALWDQTMVSGSPPGGGWASGSFAYGNLCTKAMIQSAIAGNAASCPTTDIAGHGTHVAGTAAGNGADAGTGTQYQYAGVAPAADLVIVKGGNGSFAFNNIIDGLAWIDSTAARLGKPAVVNLSLGGQFGARDGTSDPERMIDGLARPGFVITVAAGNDGNNGSSLGTHPNGNIHAGSLTTTGATQAFSFTVPQYVPNAGRCNDAQDLELWYPGQDNLDVTVVRPDGSSYTAPRGTSGDKAQDNPSGAIVIDNASAGPDPINQDNQAEIEINDCGASAATPVPGTWTVQVTARSAPSGKMYHLWLGGADLGGKAATGGAGFDNRYIVSAPGTAKSVITVGAFTTRTSWRSATGNFHYVDATALGDIAEYSAAGPTRDGRRKPDIVAPGSTVLSALSRDYPITTSNAPLVSIDGKHWALEGTSMATPHATGAIALLLQVDKTLGADEVRALLGTNATQDVFTAKTYGGGSPSDWWGGGKLNVKAALGAMNANPNAIAGVTITQRADTLVRGATDKLAALVYNGFGAKLDSTIVWSSKDPSVATVDATGLVTAKANGNTWIVAAAGTFRDSTSIVVVPPSTLTYSGGSAAPQKATLSLKGTRLPLVTVALKVNGFEAMKITSLAFQVTGKDPAARLLLFKDADGSGTLGSGDPQIAAVPAALNGASTPVTAIFNLDSLTVPANGSMQLILAVEMSGQSPNGSSFTASLASSGTHTLGVRSQAVDQLGTGNGSVVSAPALTTVLGANEVFALSENPVRSGHVIFNFSETPTVAAVYTITGRRVVDLIPRLENGSRVDWRLTNDDGAVVAPGIYLIVFDVGGKTVRQKLFIATSASSAGASLQE